MIGKEHDAPGTDIEVVETIVILIVTREIIRDGQTVRGRKFDDTAAEFRATGVRVEISIPGCEIQIRVGVHSDSTASHPNWAVVPLGVELKMRLDRSWRLEAL